MFFNKQRKTLPIVYNPLSVQAVFFKQASNLRVDGRLLVNSDHHGLDRSIISFSIVDSAVSDFLGARPDVMFTPSLLAVIFEQAREAGFTPLSLLSYGKINIHTGVLKETKERFGAFKRLSLDPGSESVGQALVHDPRSSLAYPLELRIPELVDTKILFTPELFHYIFECIRAEGMTPHTLLSFQTQEAEDYRPYYERIVKAEENEQMDSVVPLSNTILEQSRLSLSQKSSQAAVTNSDLPAVIRFRGKGKESAAL